MDDAAIGQLMAMGYEHKDVVNALNAANQNINLATQYLIDGLPQDKDKKKNKSQNQNIKSEPTDESKTADDTKPTLSEKISNLMSMGFDVNDAKSALKQCDNDQERAASYLLDKKRDPDAAVHYILNKEKQTATKKPKSAYYLYSSTAAHEAVKYLPKKIDKTEAAKTMNSKVNKVGSEWNTGATMEQYDYTEWMKKRLKELLLNEVQLKCKQSVQTLKISEVVNVDGSATFLVVRNKLRPGFDINFECKWTGEVLMNLKNAKVEGKIVMNDITSEDDEDEWEYSVTISENRKEHRMARDVVRSDVNRQLIVSVLQRLIKEFRAKKK